MAFFSHRSFLHQHALLEFVRTRDVRQTRIQHITVSELQSDVID